MKRDDNMTIQDSNDRLSTRIEYVMKKAMVASIGSLITSLFVTPFDVAKTRLQAQGRSVSSICPEATPTTYCHCTHYRFSNGIMDHMIPKSKLVVHMKVKHLNGTIDALKHIIRTDGVTGLWSGLPPTLLIAIPANVFYLSTYDYLLHKGKERFLGYEAMVPLLSGVISRSIASSIVSPLELVRTRMQAKSTSEGLYDVMIRVVRSGGILSLWRGLGPTLYRDVPFSAIYWTTYEKCKSLMSSNHGDSLNPTTIAFISGSISGGIAACCTHPFDLVKTRHQLQTYSTELVPQNSIPRSASQTLLKIFREEGIAGSFVGLSARLTKVVPACAIMISTFEFGKNLLNLSPHQSNVQ